MSYKTGDVVLVKFPFTNLKKSKKRPVLIVKDENELNDIVCFQITSNYQQQNVLKIQNNNFVNDSLPLDSYIKYDKCFTISTDIVDKKIAMLNSDFLFRLKQVFCKELF